MGDEPLKSSYELAMEKLKARDKERGLDSDEALTAEQKVKIAEVRTQSKAKLAELEILWQSDRRKVEHDPEALLKAEQRYVAERARIEERAEADIEKVRDRK